MNIHHQDNGSRLWEAVNHFVANLDLHASFNTESNSVATTASNVPAKVQTCTERVLTYLFFPDISCKLWQFTSR